MFKSINSLNHWQVFLKPVNPTSRFGVGYFFHKLLNLARAEAGFRNVIPLYTKDAIALLVCDYEAQPVVRIALLYVELHR